MLNDQVTSLSLSLSVSNPAGSNQSSDAIKSYLLNGVIEPLLIQGDVLTILKRIPSESIDMIMTSPPYWNQREYDSGGIGLEKNYQEFINLLLEITVELKRVLKPTGSFWLNMNDTYQNKHLLGIPWRIALKMIDEQGWILRNEVIWNKIKGGMDNSKSKLGNVHETIFHFVKNSSKYFYDIDPVRAKPREAKVVNGSIVSATGISGVSYKRKIELSTELTDEEKTNALLALEEMLEKLKRGEYSDFRMVIRGANRITHSDSEKVSGRAKELQTKGYYFLKYHPDGSKPSDVWEILPSTPQKSSKHSSSYPIDLCRIPILTTCPKNGIVLDPFVGTGTTCVAAKILGRKSVGIDLSKNYLETAKSRLKNE